MKLYPSVINPGAWTPDEPDQVFEGMLCAIVVKQHATEGILHLLRYELEQPEPIEEEPFHDKYGEAAAWRYTAQWNQRIIKELHKKIYRLESSLRDIICIGLADYIEELQQLLDGKWVRCDSEKLNTVITDFQPLDEK